MVTLYSTYIETKCNFEYFYDSDGIRFCNEYCTITSDRNDVRDSSYASTYQTDSLAISYNKHSVTDYGFFYDSTQVTTTLKYE